MENNTLSQCWEQGSPFGFSQGVVHKGYKSSYELIFYTDGHTDKKQAIKKALRFLNEKYSISQ